jgi:hypothetical protein
MSKGSSPRPHDKDKFDENFEKIFGAKKRNKNGDKGKKSNSK